MKVEFKVEGRDRETLEAAARYILQRFVGRAVDPSTITLEARPILHKWQEEHPALWEADVRAEV